MVAHPFVPKTAIDINVVITHNHESKYPVNILICIPLRILLPMRRLILISLLTLLCYAPAKAANADSSKKNKAQLIVLPVVAKSIETSWSFGAAASATFHLFKHDTIARTSNLQALSLYSIKRQFIVAVTGTQYFKRETYILSEQISYSYFPDKFWGLGNKTPDSAGESYTFRQYYFTPHLMRNLGSDLYIGIPLEIQKVLSVDYKHGGDFDKQNIAGRRPYFIAGLGLSFTYDDRNNAFAPDKGYFAQVYVNHFDRYLGSDYVYTNYVVDLRKYITIYDRQVLALQAYTFNNTGNVPLRSLASFGGNNSMRGYYDGRYKDKNQFTIQAEYRLPIYRRFGAVVFGGVGDVSHRISDYRLADLKYSYGGGLRFALNRTERLNLRLDYGIGGGRNHGLYLQIGEAF